MTQENVEIVREVVTEFTTSRRLSPKVAPEFVWDMSGANWRGKTSSNVQKAQGRKPDAFRYTLVTCFTL